MLSFGNNTLSQEDVVWFQWPKWQVAISSVRMRVGGLSSSPRVSRVGLYSIRMLWIDQCPHKLHFKLKYDDHYRLLWIFWRSLISIVCLNNNDCFNPVNSTFKKFFNIFFFMHLIESLFSKIKLLLLCKRCVGLNFGDLFHFFYNSKMCGYLL